MDQYALEGAVLSDCTSSLVANLANSTARYIAAEEELAGGRPESGGQIQVEILQGANVPA